MALPCTAPEGSLNAELNRVNGERRECWAKQDLWREEFQTDTL